MGLTSKMEVWRLPSLTNMEPRTRVKLAFVLDCTGSMEPWIHAAKTKIGEMVDKVTSEHTEADVEVALVGYRDYDDRERFVIVDFTTPEAVMERLRNVEAEGGGDEAEDVARALQQTLGLFWDNAEVRMVVHIADAPAHGVMFHGGHVSDQFPNGDPEGNDPCKSLQIMSGDGFFYTFVKITSATDTMLDVFHNAWNGAGVFQVIDLSPQKIGRRQGADMLSPSVSRAVSQAIDHYTLSQGK